MLPRKVSFILFGEQCDVMAADGTQFEALKTQMEN